MVHLTSFHLISLTVIPPYQESKNEPVSHPPDSLTSTNVGSHDGEELEGSGTASSDDRSEFEVIFQKRVRVFYRGFQTREN